MHDIAQHTPLAAEVAMAESERNADEIIVCGRLLPTA